MLTSKKEYFWDGSLSELKSFVKNNLGLSGKWTSPGGEVKLFTNANFRLKWQGSSIKRLVIIKDDEKDYLVKALRKYAIDQSDDTERCSVELNRADAAKTKSPSDDCSKYDIDMAELKLDVAMLTALLHKDQEKLTSQSASIVEFQALTQYLLRENEKRAAELESVKASINRLASGDEYVIRVDDNEVNNTVSLASRSSIRRLDVHDSECVDTNKSKLSYGPPSTEYASSNKVDAQTRVSEGIQRSVPEVTHLGNRKSNDKQHGNLHTSNTSLNNNFNTIPVCTTNRGHACNTKSNRTFSNP